MKLLIAEDSKFIRQIVKAGFSKEGFEVFEAENGEEALEIINREIPDVIILDYMMPVKNGIEVTKAIKADEKTKRIPVFILSAHREDDIFLDAMDIGVKGYLFKPFNIKEVIDKIKSVVKP